jgi:hypothetical protein
MDSSHTIGVVTVTYNSADVLPDFLHSIAIQTYCDFQLFVVDNGSKDETIRLLGSCPDQRLRIIANSDNRGVAEGNNQGIRAAIAAGCGSILLINNDTAFRENLVQELVDGMDRLHCDMVSPKILYFDEPERIWAAGGTFQPWLGYRAKHFGEGVMDRGQFDAVRQVGYAPTCCVLIRSEVFSSVGLMDPRYFVYVDDVDFMYRAQKAGKLLIYLPQSILLHKVGRLTGGEESAFSILYGTRNRLFFLLKNFGMLRSLPWMIALQISWLFVFLFRKKKMEWFRLKQNAFQASLKMWTERNIAKSR